MMKKNFFFIFLFFILFYLFINFDFFLYMEKSFINFPSFFFFPINFFSSLDSEAKNFLFMVSMVCSLVVLYSEFYMENYNNKKFIYLVLSFLISMIILSFGGSYIIMMLGWEMLGLSSLFLIMFYPTKITMFNSFMTFFYNRVGDCVMMLILCLLMNNSSLSLWYGYEKDFFLISLLLVLCSFTKSAQFPLSSWLPAAMSAPTPISAMVHSSTLVTAGIYLILKFIYILEDLGFLNILFFHACLTFLVGGFLGVLELDLKKIVAFSTMSQVSMIIIFSCLIFIGLAFNHMIFHSLFKTLLFCSCGVSFFLMYSDQISKVTQLVYSSNYFFFILFISIFCMSGIPFSSSFFSKDLFAESCLCSMNSYISFFFIIGSMMTILYSSKIFSMVSKSYYYLITSSYKKKSFFMYLFIFSMMALFFPYLIEFFSPVSINPVVSYLDLSLIMWVIIFPMMLIISYSHFFSFISADIFFSKFISFSYFSKFLSSDKFSFHLNDQLIFKPNIFFNMKKFFFMNLFSFTIFIVFLFIYFLSFK